MTAKLTAAILHDSLDAGRSVAEIAVTAAVSPGRVYQLMRKLGRSATIVAAARTDRARGTVECRTLAGYRVANDGRVQSCWTAGPHPVRTDSWHDLTIQMHRPGTRSASLYVRIGGAKRRHRPSLLTVYRDAFGERRAAKAEALYQTMRRKMGLE